MASLKSESREDVLLISITTVKILDDLVVRDLQNEMLDAITKSRSPKVLLDFGLVKSLSSFALGMLIRCRALRKHNRLWMKLCSIDPEIQRAFKITGLNQVLEMHRNVADAMRALREDDSSGGAGVFAKLKPQPSGDAAAREPGADEE